MSMLVISSYKMKLPLPCDIRKCSVQDLRKQVNKQETAKFIHDQKYIDFDFRMKITQYLLGENATRFTTRACGL